MSYSILQSADGQTIGAANPLPVSSGGYRSSIPITRPNNTTAYTANDVIGVDASGSAGSAIHEFTNIGPAGGSILITSVELMIALAAIPSGMTSFRLYLYDAPPTAILDNAAWDIPSGDRAAFLGYVDLGTPIDLGSTLYVRTDNVNQQFKLAAGVTSLFGELVTNGGYTPAANTVYTPRIAAVGL